MQLQLRKSDLKAALICSAVKDIRYYLNGVLVEYTPRESGGILTFCGTDGHILFAGTAPAEFMDGEHAQAFSLIIPSDTVKAACKGKMPIVTLSSLPDGRYSLGDALFTAIDGRFPDFRRVIPAKVSGEFAHFDFDLLARGNDALCEYFNMPKKTFSLHPSGNGAGVMCGNSRDAVVVVMPMREPNGGTGEYTGTDIPPAQDNVTQLREAA